MSIIPIIRATIPELRQVLKVLEKHNNFIDWFEISQYEGEHGDRYNYLILGYDTDLGPEYDRTYSYFKGIMDGVLAQIRDSVL